MWLLGVSKYIRQKNDVMLILSYSLKLYENKSSRRTFIRGYSETYKEYDNDNDNHEIPKKIRETF